MLRLKRDEVLGWTLVSSTIRNVRPLSRTHELIATASGRNKAMRPASYWFLLVRRARTRVRRFEKA